MTICTPTSGATVTSPVRVVAGTTNSQRITVLQIYLDGVKVHEVEAGSLDISVPMASGTRRLTVQSLDAASRWIKQTIYINVGTSQPGVSVDVSPQSATMASGASQQFAAIVSGTPNTAVTWSSSGGTVSSAGLFTASQPGSYTVTARSVADATKSASAAVTVGASQAGTAHLWIDGSGTCTRNSSPAAYDSASACASFDAANDVAQNGDTILIKGGTYGSQSINGNNDRTEVATMESAPGETVTIAGNLGISGRFITVQGASNANRLIVTQDVSLGAKAIADMHVTVKWLNLRAIFIRGGFINLLNSTIGNFNNCDLAAEKDGLKISYDSATKLPSRDILVEGNLFENIRRVGGCGFHTDSVQLMGCVRCAFRGNSYVNGPTEHVIARPQAGNAVPIRDITFENEMFGPVLDGSQALNLGSPGDTACSGILVQNVTIANGTMDLGCSGSNMGVVRNSILGGLSGTNATFSYNVFRGGSRKVGSNAVQCNPAYVDASRANWRLAAGDSCAVNRADPTNYASQDFDGESRSSPADVGADELTGGATASATRVAGASAEGTAGGTARATEPASPIVAATLPSPLSLLVPTSIVFSSIPAGTTSSQTIVLTNTSGSTLTLSQANLSDAVFSITAPVFPVSLDPGQSGTVTVQFAPNAAGIFNGTLALVGSGSTLAAIPVSAAASDVVVSHWQ